MNKIVEITELLENISSSVWPYKSCPIDLPSKTEYSQLIGRYERFVQFHLLLVSWSIEINIPVDKLIKLWMYNYLKLPKALQFVEAGDWMNILAKIYSYNTTEP